MNSAPLFIIGTERSGSNLLRLILNAHSAIAVPHPPHILKFFSPLENSYGDLSRPEKLNKLVRDVLGLVAVHIYKWEKQPTVEEVMASARPPDLIGVFFSIYNSYLKQSGKRRWGCKSTFMIHHISRVLEVCPQAKFLFLVRDPRDVAASSRQSIFSPFHPYFTACLWRRQQLEGLRLYDSGAGRSCCLIRYEDLIEDPTNTVKMICNFIGEEYEPTMLKFYRTESARKSESLSGAWKNTASPILKGNRNTFITGLRPAEIRLVEAITGDLMVRFGYPFFSQKQARHQARQLGESFSAPEPGWLKFLLYRLMNFYWAVRVEIRSMRYDRNYRQFWRRRMFLLRLHLRFLGKRHFFTLQPSGKE